MEFQYKIKVLVADINGGGGGIPKKLSLSYSTQMEDDSGVFNGNDRINIYLPYKKTKTGYREDLEEKEFLVTVKLIK